MNKDLTVGKPFNVLLKFCLPLFGSVIFQQLYNIADSFVAGKFVSENALAAVGNSYEITLIFIAFSFGCNIGCSVVVSQLFGAKNYRDLKTAVYTTLIAGGVLCAVLMTCGLVFCSDLLQLIKTPQNIFADSKLYLDIYIWGLPFVFYYNISTGIFSALGDSKTPFYFLTASSAVNIGMDILFVTALRPIFTRGVDGVAWATFICQGISCVLALWFVLKRLKKIEVKEKAHLFSWNALGKIAVIAVPSILQQSFISVGNIIIQGVINGFGSSVVAGYSAAIKLNNLVITSFTTMGNGISNFTAQNIGAGKRDRVMQGFKAGIKLIMCICIPASLIYLIAGRYLLLLFLEKDAVTATKAAVAFLSIAAPFYFTVATKLVADGVLRGTGSMNKFMIATFTDLTLRVVLAIALSNALGWVGIWIAWPIGWAVSTALSLLFCLKGELKTKG